jgi:hypothetical protein
MFKGFPELELSASRARRRPGVIATPFIIYTAGRSRTAWLSAFLTYGKCVCHNEIAAGFRDWTEVVDVFSDGVGSAETAAAPAWRLFKHFVPSAKTVVVQRDVDDIVASFARHEIAEIATVDEDKLRKVVSYSNRCLQEISTQPGVLTVQFADLEREAACRQVFEHCLPYEFDRAWWRDLAAQNIQTDALSLVRYFQENFDAIEGFKRGSKRVLRELVRSGAVARPNGGASDAVG